jgi:serine/threonine-protein kinase
MPAGEGARAPSERSWAFAPGDAIAPGLHAWALLGDGRRCETWLAWCLERCAPVAVKLPRPGRVDGRSREALAREARMARALVHPGVQRLLGEALGGERPHLVFEYVEGPTLESKLDEDGPLRPGDVARLGLQLASVLHYVHGRGVVHCDVKPSNVALRDGRAVLLDFDVARATGEAGDAARARGTADYMAPEQVRGGCARPAMDLFALGATLYEAAAGAPAFAGSDDGPVVYAQLEGPPPPLRALDPSIPAPLERAVLALLDPDPGRRPSSALAALALLARALPAREPGLWPRWMGRVLRGAAAATPGGG